MRIVELPIHPSMVGRIFSVDSAGSRGSAVRDDTGIAIEATHTGELLVHLGRQVAGDEAYLARTDPTEDGEDA